MKIQPYLGLIESVRLSLDTNANPYPYKADVIHMRLAVMHGYQVD